MYWILTRFLSIDCLIIVIDPIDPQFHQGSLHHRDSCCIFIIKATIHMCDSYIFFLSKVTIHLCDSYCFFLIKVKIHFCDSYCFFIIWRHNAPMWLPSSPYGWSARSIHRGWSVHIPRWSPPWLLQPISLPPLFIYNFESHTPVTIPPSDCLPAIFYFNHPFITENSNQLVAHAHLLPNTLNIIMIMQRETWYRMLISTLAKCSEPHTIHTCPRYYHNM
jgi:hypothetical protein